VGPAGVPTASHLGIAVSRVSAALRQERKTPNPKLQIPSKSKAPNPKAQDGRLSALDFHFRRLGFVSDFGLQISDLGFQISDFVNDLSLL
jgi:hypothetical protein